MIKFFKKNLFTIIYLILGISFLLAGFSKFLNISKFKLVLCSYNIACGEIDTLIIAWSIIIFEIVIGSVFIFKKVNKSTCFISFLFFISIALLILINMGNVLPYGCGCFITGKEKMVKVGFYDLMYDIILGGMSYFCFIKNK